MAINLRPKFESFRLISAEVKNEEFRQVKDAQYEFVVDREIDIGVGVPAENAAPTIMIVHVSFTGRSKLVGGDVAVEPVATIQAKYQAIFKFEEYQSAADLEAVMDAHDELQFTVASQATALALNNFKGMIHVMGYETKFLGYGI